MTGKDIFLETADVRPIPAEILFPYPFCGAPPDFREWSSKRWTIEVTCLNKIYSVRPHTPLCRSRTDVVAIWNHRIP